LPISRAKGGRRVIKSHMPADTVPIDPRVRYIYVGRDGRNVVLSFHHYLSHFTRETRAKIDKIYREKTGGKKSWRSPQGGGNFSTSG
jgi:aryl sulfotransferase